VNVLSVLAKCFLGSRKNRSRRSRSLEPVEKLMLTPQHALHLIRVAGRDVIIATHPQGCTLIHSSVAGSASAAPIELGAGA
jgi:hypothetical protein